MSALAGTPGGSWAPIIRASQRLVPTCELEADLVAVSRAGGVSTREDWLAGTLTNVGVSSRGEVRLAPSGAGAIMLENIGTVSWLDFRDGAGGRHEYTIDVFPDPAWSGGQPITLDTLTLQLKRNQVFPFVYASPFLITIEAYDDQWRRVALGDPIEVGVDRAPFPQGEVVLRLVQDFGREFVFEPGLALSRTGPGLDGSGNRRDVDAVDGVSQLRTWRGFSIRISLPGLGHEGAALGVINAAPFFTPADFWRSLAGRNHGPYAPQVPPLDPRASVDPLCSTGAVPGYGALPCACGLWGIARRVEVPGRAQNGNFWFRPWVRLTARTLAPSGSIVVPIDLGAVPTNPVQFRADDWVRARTSIAYSLRGRNAPGDAWTAIGAVQDGAELGPGQRFRSYEVTASLSATPVAGGVAVASPVLQAVQLVERIRSRTEGLTDAIDGDTTVDPVTGQAAIAELVLPLLRGGLPDGRDLASSIASGVAPSRLEAHLFAADRATGARKFVDAFRLESRTPSLGQEEFRFTSGLDRLQVRIPPQVETYTLPIDGAAPPTVSNVAGSGTSRTFTLTGPGASWAVGQLNGFRLRLLNGTWAGTDYVITATPTTTAVTVELPPTGIVPVLGTQVEIRSDVYRRQDIVYTGVDPATVFIDVLTQLARVPRRLIGALPETGRVRDAAGTVLLTSGRIKAGSGEGEGVTALSVLQALAVLLGGAIVWRRGLIEFVDLATPRESAAVWDERDYARLETPTGLDRRMPSISCKFGKDPATGNYAGEVVTNDLDVIGAAGRANLFDVYQVPDEVATWCTSQALATALVTRLRSQFAAGPKLWRVELVHQWPWLDIGDAVTVVTDQYTDRLYRFSGDGLTDESTPLFGRLAGTGVIVGRNLQADRFLVLVRDVVLAPRLITGGGPVDGPLAPIPAPTITLTLEDGGIGVGYTPPASPYLDFLEYILRTKDAGAPVGSYGPATRVPGTKSGIDRIALVVDVAQDAEVTPVTVSVGGARATGTPVTILVPATAGGGAPGASIQVEYGPTATGPWDSTFTLGVDLFMRQRVGTGPWSDGIRIVGEQGAPGGSGPAGNFVDFRFLRSATAPATPTDPVPAGWSDGPPAGTDPLWFTKATKTAAGALVTGWSAPVRLDGEDGTAPPASRFTSVTVNVPSAPSDQITLSWSVADMPSGVSYTALLFVRGSQREYPGVTSGFQFQLGRNFPDASYPQEFRVTGTLFALDPSGQTVATRVVPTTVYYSSVNET